MDCRDLNSESQRNAYSLPLINNLLQKQQGKRIFTILHLKHGYHQMPLVESSQDATSMWTPLAPLRPKVIPPGLKNGNAQFQRMTEDVLRELDSEDLFVDGIIVSRGMPETTDDEVIDTNCLHLCRVPDIIHKHQLTCNGGKAVLFAAEVEYAGQVVGHTIYRPLLGKLASLTH